MEAIRKESIQKQEMGGNIFPTFIRKEIKSIEKTTKPNHNTKETEETSKKIEEFEELKRKRENRARFFTMLGIFSFLAGISPTDIVLSKEEKLLQFLAICLSGASFLKALECLKDSRKSAKETQKLESYKK
jgi:hypothetical protein